MLVASLLQPGQSPESSSLSRLHLSCVVSAACLALGSACVRPAHCGLHACTDAACLSRAQCKVNLHACTDAACLSCACPRSDGVVVCPCCVCRCARLLVSPGKWSRAARWCEDLLQVCAFGHATDLLQIPKFARADAARQLGLRARVRRWSQGAPTLVAHYETLCNSPALVCVCVYVLLRPP